MAIDTITIVGPDAVFKAYDPANPNSADSMPNETAYPNIWRMEPLTFLAAAAGMMSSAVTRIIPISLMEDAIVTARRTISAYSIAATGTPCTAAMSRLRA